jgi:hypothetical protein
MPVREGVRKTFRDWRRCARALDAAMNMLMAYGLFEKVEDRVDLRRCALDAARIHSAPVSLTVNHVAKRIATTRQAITRTPRTLRTQIRNRRGGLSRSQS